MEEYVKDLLRYTPARKKTEDAATVSFTAAQSVED